MASNQSIFRSGLSDGQAGIVAGAGSGIGRCTAHELAALGARVALVGRKAEKLDAVAREIADAGGSARCYAADIREKSAWRKSCARCWPTSPVSIFWSTTRAGSFHRRW